MLTNQAKVLFFVDDDSDFLYFVERACSTMPWVSGIKTAEDGVSALEKLKIWADEQSLPDVMFVDINMPRMDGFEFLREFFVKRESDKRLGSILPIIMLSSSRDPKDVAKVASFLSVDNYWLKPDSVKEIRNLIGKLAG